MKLKGIGIAIVAMTLATQLTVAQAPGGANKQESASKLEQMSQ